MLYKDKFFIIHYNECDKKYLEKLVTILKRKMPDILDFFKFNYNKRIVIKIYDNIEEYKNNLEESFKREAQIKRLKKVREYKSWMIANTEDGNINMQSLDLVKIQSYYKYYTEEEFCYNACHEFVHLCQHQIKSENPGWFWEVIATVLGNPECQHEIKENFTLEDLNNSFDKIDGYGAAYKIGKYLFENYDEDYILSLVKNNDKLISEISSIIQVINNKKYK